MLRLERRCRCCNSIWRCFSIHLFVEHWRNHWRQDDPGTFDVGDVYGGGSPTGVAFYENGALDPKWNGLLLACEAGKNVVFGYLPKPDGAGMKLERFDFLTSNKEKEWAGSDFLGGKATGSFLGRIEVAREGIEAIVAFLEREGGLVLSAA